MSEQEKNASDQQQPEILVNQYGAVPEPTIVVAEDDRTVVLGEEETIVIEKLETYEVIPANRPRKVYSGMWGPWEAAAFSVSLLTLLGVIALYFFWVRPSAVELADNRAERNRLELEVISARAKYGDITSTEGRVSELISSVENFESTYLPIASSGQTSLYQKLNTLIAGYGLVNTNGPNYAPLEISEQRNGEQRVEETGRAKYKSIFPGVYVTMTLEGPYHNLRRFIREIETSGDFIVISSVELEPTEAKQKRADETPQQPQQQPQTFGANPFGRPGDMRFQQPAQQQPAKPQGKTHGETVSLRLEMAAYFRRTGYTPTLE